MATKVKIPTDLQEIAFDWKEFSSEAEDVIAEALHGFGIKMYSNPAFEGSDTYGYFLTKAKLSRKQVKAIAKELYDDE